MFWVKGKKDIRMKDDNIEMASDKLLEIKSYIPVEFTRLPRSLKEMDRFKATEFRQILLYTGPINFNNNLTKHQYLHFMSLHCSILILCSSELYIKYNDYANQLLVYFVKNFGNLYGFEFISHNIHNLIHLASDSKMHGPLDDFSSFRFENYLYQMKKNFKMQDIPYSRF